MVRGLLRPTFLLAFWVYYDRLGAFTLWSVAFAVAVLPPLLAIPPILFSVWPLPWKLPLALLALAGAGAAGGTAGTAVLAYARALIETRDTSVSQALADRALLIRGAALGGCWALLACTMLFSVYFYAAGLSRAYPAAGYGLAAAGGWMLLAYLMCSPWLLPALVHRRGDPGRAVSTALRLSVRHPVVSLAMLAASGVVLAACVVAPPLIVLAAPAWLMLLPMCGYEWLSHRYGGDPAEAQVLESEYLSRSLSAFWQPWKQ